MNPASFSATVIVLIFAVLCKGLRSQNLVYNLTVPASVSVQRGLCIHIPCSFTYDQRDRTNPMKLYGYWFQKKDDYWHYFTHEAHLRIRDIVATNDKRQELRVSVLTRFQLTGEPEEGDCSFSVLDAKSEDAGEYYFRIEDNQLGWNYIFQKPQVLVTELEEPQIWASSAVFSGKEALYTCLAPGPCVEIEARISWTTALTGYRTTDWRQQHINGSWTYGSNFTFTPSLNDQGRELTCRVWYPNIQEQVEKSIQLDVAEGPPSSPAPPSTTKGVSSPLPSTSCPPSLSELPVPPLSSSQTPCDGRSLWEEFSFLSESQSQAGKPRTQFVHSCKELTSAVIHLTEKFRKALLRIRQRIRFAPSKIKE